MHAFQSSRNPRVNTCERCGRTPEACAAAQGPPSLRPRDPAAERAYTDLAARAIGLTGDRGLRAYADWRCAPGGVRVGCDWVAELREEIGDAANYAPWALEELEAAYGAGDPEAAAEYARVLRAFSHVVAAWAALNEGGS